MISKSIQGFILLLVIAYVPIEFLKIFACHPISAYWDIPEKPGVMGDNPNCLGQAKFFMGDIVIALVTDLIILILPIPLTWAMEAPWRQKIKIIILLGAGGAATIATAIRAYLNVQFMTSNGMSPLFLVCMHRYDALSLSGTDRFVRRHQRLRLVVYISVSDSIVVVLFQILCLI